MVVKADGLAAGKGVILAHDLATAHAAIDEAHRRGMRVAVHARSAAAVKQAVRFGADFIGHANYLDDEAVDMLRAARDRLFVGPAIAWEVQFLANRGYCVLQMNFRGSTGYGRAFWQASFGQWGLKMQDDITDGVEWLVKQGIADKSRVGIYGASYGGYATLAGVAFTPELYAAAVNYVGVSNLFTFMNARRRILAIIYKWEALFSLSHTHFLSF